MRRAAFAATVAGVMASAAAWAQQVSPCRCALSAQSQCEANCPYPCTGNPPRCDTSIDSGGGYQCPFSQCSPLVLDLNGDGIHTTTLAEAVSFDLTGDGHPERLAWTNPRTEEAFLWTDLDANGRVDDGRELFGQGTRLHDGRTAAHGFEALTQYDSPLLGGNGDGLISTGDRVWNRLRLWVDADHDGICAPAESGPVAEYGLVEIALTYTVDETTDQSGNMHRYRGTYRRWLRGHGRPQQKTLTMNDVFFSAQPAQR